MGKALQPIRLSLNSDLDGAIEDVSAIGQAIVHASLELVSVQVLDENGEPTDATCVISWSDNACEQLGTLARDAVIATAISRNGAVGHG